MDSIFEDFVQSDLDIGGPTKRARVIARQGGLGEYFVGTALSHFAVDPGEGPGLVLVSSELLATLDGIQEVFLVIGVVLDISLRDWHRGLDTPLEVGIPSVEAVTLTNQLDLRWVCSWPRHCYVSMYQQFPKECEVDGANELLAVHGER